MSTSTNLHRSEPRDDGNELTRISRRIQALVTELHELRRHTGAGDSKLRAKQNELERLRWQLARVARRKTDNFNAAA